MDKAERVDRTGNRAIAHILLPMVMPDLDVTPRTQATYDNGARQLLQHIMEGDWDVAADPSALDPIVIRAFIGNVIANAERQGINIADVSK